MRVDSDTWQQVLTRDKGWCRYCGEDLLASAVAFSCAQVDHVVAVAADGSSDPSNLVLSCATCNNALSRSAHLRTFDERKVVALAGKRKLIENFGSWLPLRQENPARTT
ncbi:MAG: HNH endonuclease [Nevskiaceae bacterium]|nr:MAG: HNH endonuclease [Nevskiaceae bacterium]TAM31837.1 MAG: HNH endonuclease [Nevskiaceae bacterium]